MAACSARSTPIRCTRQAQGRRQRALGLARRRAHTLAGRRAVATGPGCVQLARPSRPPLLLLIQGGFPPGPAHLQDATREEEDGHLGCAVAAEAHAHEGAGGSCTQHWSLAAGVSGCGQGQEPKAPLQSSTCAVQLGVEVMGRAWVGALQASGFEAAAQAWLLQASGSRLHSMHGATSCVARPSPAPSSSRKRNR